MLALILPLVVEVAFDHRSLTEYELEPASPTSAALLVMVAAVVSRLNSTTATDPSDIGLAQTSWLPDWRSRRPWEPPQSWFTAITSVFLMIARFVLFTERRSLPRMSGALSSAHRLKCAVYSV